jgi:hypothetical protein
MGECGSARESKGWERTLFDRAVPGPARVLENTKPHCRSMFGWYTWHARQHDLLLLLGVLVVLLCVSWLAGRFRRYRRSQLAKRALGAERAGFALLRRLGYVVVDTQVQQVWTVRHGAHHLDVKLRADAIVKRDGRRFIAEVKSSSLVADLKHGPTRRQLLEYAVAYRAEGVLLVDMHAQHVEEITFPGLDVPAPHKKWPYLAACALAFALGLSSAMVSPGGVFHNLYWSGSRGPVVPAPSD